MRLISDEYKELNRRLHDECSDFGQIKERRLVNRMKKLRVVLAKYQPRDILDYGCGKGGLAQAYPRYLWREYDPCIPGKDKLPSPADLVVCNDVMEHVELEYLNNVLLHLKNMSRRAVFFVIGLRPSNKELPDGRNAHITLMQAEEWLELLANYFSIVEHWTVGGRDGQPGKLFVVGETNECQS